MASNTSKEAYDTACARASRLYLVHPLCLALYIHGINQYKSGNAGKKYPDHPSQNNALFNDDVMIGERAFIPTPVLGDRGSSFFDHDD